MVGVIQKYYPLRFIFPRLVSRKKELLKRGVEGDQGVATIGENRILRGEYLVELLKRCDSSEG